MVVAVPVSARMNPSVEVPLPTAFGNPNSISISAALGAISDSISIEVPRGRRGVKPQMRLSYSSLGGNGIAGRGWALSSGSVERWSGDGTPSVEATINGTPSDRYSYSVAGASGELHDENDDGIYRARTESVFRPFRKAGDGWLMHDGQGVAYSFGSSADSRIDDELWMIERVQDTSGNTIQYVYDVECGLLPSGAPCDADNASLHLTAVRYTGYAPTSDPGANLITFEYEQRPDRAVSYRRGVREARNLRLQKVNVYAQGVFVRGYELNYEQYADGPSLLTQVDLVGSDEQTRITLRTMEYGERALGWPAMVQAPSLPVALADVDGTGTGAQLMDVDGDALADLLNNGESVYLGDGLGDFTMSASWSASLLSANASIVGDDGIDTGVRYLDVNGDARVDILVATPTRTEVWLNTGSGWEQDADWTTNLAGISALNIALVDSSAPTNCRAPLCSDFGESPPAGCSAPYCTGDVETDPEDCLELEEGEEEAPFCSVSNYSDPGTEPFSIVGELGESKGVEFADVNADGRADIVWSLKFDQSTFLGETPRIVRAVFLNGGTDNPGWHRSDSLSGALANVLTNQGGAAGAFIVENAYEGYSFMDANGDGFSDIVRSIEGKQAVYLGRGGSWELDDGYTNSLINQNLYELDEDFESQGLIPIDFNDDGLVDYLRARGGQPVEVYLNTGTEWLLDGPMSTLLAGTGIVFIGSDNKATGATLADIDGNGVIDLISAKEGEQDQILLGDALRSGNLKLAVSALGQVTEIDWIASTAFDHTTDAGIHGLPIAMTLVDVMSRSDGQGNTFVADVDYEGGLYTTKGFRGFSIVTQTPSAGLKAESRYIQDDDLAFQPYEVRLFDSTDTMRSLSETETTLQATADPGVDQVLLTATRTRRYAANGDLTTSSYVEREYDEYLQATSVYSDPQEEIAGDEQTTTYEYAQYLSTTFWAGITRITATNPAGEILSQSETEFDTRGLPVLARELVSAGEFVETAIAYDDFGNVESVTDRAGGVTTFAYDPTGTFRVEGVDALGRTKRSEYDPGFGGLITDYGASGNATTTEYDVFGRKTKIVAPGDEASPYGTVTYEYSDLGDPAGQSFRLLRTENAGTSDVFETTTYFDATGTIYRVEQEGSEGVPIVTLIESGPDGQAAASSLPFFDGYAPAWVQSERDELGRLTAIIDPLGERVEMSYNGFETAVLDARGNFTDVTVNAAGNPTQIRVDVDGAIQTTQFEYTVSGHLKSVVDAIGSETTLTYDALARRTQLNDPNAGSYSYTYDGEGRLTEQLAPDGGVTRFVHSAAGEMLEKQFPDGTTHEFHYGTGSSPNDVGRLTRVVDESGVLKLFYDERGRVTERRRTVDGRTYVTGSVYDSMNRVRQVIYPDGFVAHYSYDAGNNLAAVTDADGRPLAEGFRYNASQRITQFSFGNGVGTENSYDLMARMLSSHTQTGAGVDLQHLLYEYDAANNVLSMDDLASGRNQSFEYNEANRLVRAVGAYGEEEYAYDAVGTLLRKGDLLFAHDDPARPQRMTCGVKLRAEPKGHGPHRPRGPNRPHGPHGSHGSHGSQSSCASVLAIEPSMVLRAFDIAYDGRGNIIAKGDLRYAYDAENRMVSARDKKGKLIERSRYDARGQLVVKQVRHEKTVYIDGIYEEGKSHVSRHIRAGSLLVATVITPRSKAKLIATAHPPEDQMLYAASSSIFGLAILFNVLYRRMGALSRRELWASFEAVRKRPSILLLLIMVLFSTWPNTGYAHQDKHGGEKRLYYHANHLGSVNVVTDDASKTVAQRDFRPYGDAFAWKGKTKGPKKVSHNFQGQPFSDDTGLYNMQARHYDPELGQFMSADTVVANTNDPRTFNRYAFSGGNPVQFVDPSGRGFWSSVGDFFTGVENAIVGAGNWISDHAAEILTVIAIIAIVVLIVAAVVLTGGLAAIAIGGGLGAVAGAAGLGAAAGFAVFGGIALSQGNTADTAAFWQAAGTGLVLGALVGGALPVAFAPSILFTGGITSVSGSVAAGALIGSAAGGLEQAVACATGCGGVENLFLPVAQGIIIGGIYGAIGGGIAGKFLPRGVSTAKTGARFFAEPGKFGFILKSAYSTYSSARGPGLSGRRTASSDMFRLIKIPLGYGSIGQFQKGDTSSYFWGALDNANSGLTTAPLSN